MIGFINYFSHCKSPKNDTGLPLIITSTGLRIGTIESESPQINFNIEWKLEVNAPKGWEENSYYKYFQNEKARSQYDVLFKRYQYIVNLALHIREKYIDFIECSIQNMNIEFLIDMLHLFDMLYTYITDYSKFLKTIGIRDKKKFKLFCKNLVCNVSVNLNMKNNYK